MGTDTPLPVSAIPPLPRMSLEQLRVFVAVAEREHVTRAAEALHLTQSAASAAVQALERHFGVRLFHRAGRGIALTEAGRLLLGEARGVLARAAAAERALAELSGLRRGRLLVQASQTIASYWLPRHLVAFRARFPAIELALAIANTEAVAHAVAEGIAELGFVEGEVAEPSLAGEVVAEDRLAIVVAPGHPWAAIPALAPQRLLETGWVLREPGSGTRSAFTRALAGFGLDPALLEVSLELPSNEAVRSAVAAGGGAGAMSDLVSEALVRAGGLRRVPFALPARQFRVLRQRERYLGHAALALLGMLGVAAG